MTGISPPGIVIHNEGQVVPILDRAGAPAGYSIQLARLTCQDSGVPVLKLGLIEDATGETIS